MKSYDAVIIGAGLAGLQCARLLTREGASVLLADRKADVAEAVHTTGIFVRRSLEDFVFPPGTLGPPISGVTLYSPGLRQLKLESGKEEFRIGRMQELYKALLAECIENGARFTAGTRFVSAASDKDGSRVTLEKNSVPFEARAAVLIGADGANSAVARSLGLDTNREFIVGVEEVLRLSPGRRPHLHCFLDERLAPGYLAWIADDGQDVHIGVGGYPEGFKPREALKEFKQKIAAKIIDMDGAALLETRGGRIPVGGVLRQISCPHGILIGDAAGAVSPLTAGGLDPCLRLSGIAAGVVLDRLLTGDPEVLLSYSGSLFRSRFVSRLWMRRAISVMRSRTLLEAACFFLRGKAGSRMAKHVFFGRGSFPDIEIGDAKARKPSTASA